MYGFLLRHQETIVLAFGSMCGITAVFVLFMRALPKRRRRSLLAIQLCSMVLLFADALSYATNGKKTEFGYYGNRISNFLLFSLVIAILFAFNAYVINLFEDANKGIVPKRLKIVNYLGIAGEILVVISQFTGLYYTFNESNYYVRGRGYFISFLIPLVIFFLMESVVIQNMKKLSKVISISLLLFSTLPLIAAALQAKIYGLSLINTTIAGVGLLLYLFALKDMNETYAHANELKIEYLTTREQSMRRLFEQTAEALGSAIDARDRYTHGHSARVAAYSKTIAKMAGKDEKECEEIYYAALLHDIGNLGIKDDIFSKKGKLTPREYEEIKQHTQIGNQILSSIVEFPYLSIVANHHHERFDGRGYPDKLKGNDIPEFARIIAVADAYDAMTSKRSYRDPLPRSRVREILVEEMGAQFDPVFATQMVQMIDQDHELNMQDKTDVREFVGNYEFDFDKYRTVFTEGILVAQNSKLRLHVKISPIEGHKEKECIPALVVFDSLDGRVHESGMLAKELSYTEFAEVWFDGTNKVGKARALRPNVMRLKTALSDAVTAGRNCGEYDMEIVRQKDHILIKISSDTKIVEYIIALPDSTRFSYISFTGEYYHLSVPSIKRTENAVPDDYIPRIAKLITYIDGPEGDIPNIQMDGFRTDTTKGILLGDKLEIDFHTMSLPTARLIWHCPFVSLFGSSNGLVKDEDYHEFALIRLDGEVWESGTLASTEVIMSKDDSFEGWEKWKKINKEGFDCHISITRSGKTVTMITKNGGIFLKTITKMKTDDDIYVALTGDQVALTKIYIKQ